MHAQSPSHVRLSVALWTVALQAPLSMRFPTQEYWSDLPFPTPVDLPNPAIEPMSLASPALAGRFFTTVPPGNYTINIYCYYTISIHSLSDLF